MKTAEEVRIEMVQYCYENGDRTRLAKEINVHLSDLCAQLNGRLPPSAKLLAFFGYKRVIAYEHVPTAEEV